MIIDEVRTIINTKKRKTISNEKKLEKTKLENDEKKLEKVIAIYLGV